MKVEADRLKKVLGIARMTFHDVNHPIAITDLPLEEAAQTRGAVSMTSSSTTSALRRRRRQCRQARP